MFNTQNTTINNRLFPQDYRSGGIQGGLFGGDTLDHTPAMQEGARRLALLGLTGNGRQTFRPTEVASYDTQFKHKPHYEVTRRLGNFTVLQMSEDALYEYYPWYGRITDYENLWLLPLVSPQIGHFCIRSYYGEYLWAELDKSSKCSSALSALDRLKGMQLEIPSLVKNAMVVMRTISMIRKPILRILIRGSRAMHSGGQWVQEVALYAMRFAKKVFFDLYDPHEEPEVIDFHYSGSEAHIKRIKKMYQGTGKEYDAVVDDAWTANSQGGWRSQSEYFSEKDLGGKSDAFLHPREGRVFSHYPLESSESTCPCRLCQTIATFVSMEMFSFVRGLMVTLGASRCLSDVWADQLKERDVLLSLRAGRLDLDAKNIRILSLLNFHKKVQFTHTGAAQGPTPQHQKNVTGYFRDKRVYFVGVSPTLLGDEPYKTAPIRSTYTVDADSCTITDHISGVISAGSHIAWCPAIIPGYRATGRAFGVYAEQEKIDPGGTAKQVAHFSHVYGRPLDPAVARPLKGVFLIPKTSGEHVCGPGGTDKRKITIVNEQHAFPGGGYRVYKGKYGSYPHDYGYPVMCSHCRKATTPCPKGHLFYEAGNIRPPEWSFLLEYM